MQTLSSNLGSAPGAFIELDNEAQNVPRAPRVYAHRDVVVGQIGSVRIIDQFAQRVGQMARPLASNWYGRWDNGSTLLGLVEDGGPAANAGRIGTDVAHGAARAGYMVVSALDAFSDVEAWKTFEPRRSRKMVGPFLKTLDMFKSYMGSAHVEAFGAQLRTIFQDEEELMETGIVPSLASFIGLGRFMFTTPGIKHPNLSLTRAGEFQASWSACADRRIVLTFTDGVSARWSAVDRTVGERESGRFPIMTPAPVLGRYGVWMRP